MFLFFSVLFVVSENNELVFLCHSLRNRKPQGARQCSCPAKHQKTGCSLPQSPTRDGLVNVALAPKLWLGLLAVHAPAFAIWGVRGTLLPLWTRGTSGGIFNLLPEPPLLCGMWEFSQVPERGFSCFLWNVFSFLKRYEIFYFDVVDHELLKVFPCLGCLKEGTLLWREDDLALYCS